MSLVTRCPACTTTFKVVRDQLRISDGWVRCGRCSHVFDASLDLRDLSDTNVAPPATTAPAVAPDPVLAAPTVSAADDADFFDDEPSASVELPPPPVFPVLPDLSSPSVGLVADEPWPEPAAPGAADDDAATAATLPVRSVADMVPSLELDPVSQVQLQKALRQTRVEAVRIARARRKAASAAEVPDSPEAADATAPVVQTASEPEPVQLPPAAVPSFLRAASSGAFWQGGRGLTILTVGIVLAMLLLALQVLHRERDALVARQPGLRPSLERVCAITGCELSALRRIGDITIDGASFAREKEGDGYQFSFTLRSAATVPLAMPAIELSLLDTQEKVVVRRVLRPAEFGGPAILPARGERAASLPLTLTGAEAAALPPIAGFNVVAFYP